MAVESFDQSSEIRKWWNQSSPEIFGDYSPVPRRGSAIRLKRLKPKDTDFGEPQNFGSKDNFQHFCLHLC